MRLAVTRTRARHKQDVILVYYICIYICAHVCVSIYIYIYYMYIHMVCLFVGLSFYLFCCLLCIFDIYIIQRPSMVGGSCPITLTTMDSGNMTAQGLFGSAAEHQTPCPEGHCRAEDPV